MNGAVYINIVSIFIFAVIPVNNMHFSHLVKVRKNSHSLSLQAFLTHSHSLSLSLAGLVYPEYVYDVELFFVGLMS